jgi:DNA polymerase-3 subunit epsilon
MKINLNFWKKAEEKTYPQAITDYFALNRTREEDASKIQYVIFDTESSSLSISTAQLLSIGAVKVKENSISMKDTFHSFVQTAKYGQEGNIHIHEIMNEGKEKKQELKTVLLDFLAFIGNAVLVAHHAKHDVGLINRYLADAFPGVRLVNEVIDTADLAIKNDQMENPSVKIKSENYSLDALLKRFNISAVERHTALGDAFSTALLFLKIK